MRYAANVMAVIAAVLGSVSGRLVETQFQIDTIN